MQIVLKESSVPPSDGDPRSLKSGEEILASLNDSEGEGGLTPPPAKRPRLVPPGGGGGGGGSGSSVDRGEPSSSSQAEDSTVREDSSVGEYSGSTVEGSSSSSSTAMQANGVIHENGTTTSTSEFAVNGLGGGGGVVKSNGCEKVLYEDEEDGDLNVGGANGRVGSMPVRKRKQRQLSSKDTDIIRLIGQHLREMGFKYVTDRTLAKDSRVVIGQGSLIRS